MCACCRSLPPSPARGTGQQCERSTMIHACVPSGTMTPTTREVSTETRFLRCHNRSGMCMRATDLCPTLVQPLGRCAADSADNFVTRTLFLLSITRRTFNPGRPLLDDATRQELSRMLPQFTSGEWSPCGCTSEQVSDASTLRLQHQHER